MVHWGPPTVRLIMIRLWWEEWVWMKQSDIRFYVSVCLSVCLSVSLSAVSQYLSCLSLIVFLSGSVFYVCLSQIIFIIFVCLTIGLLYMSACLSQNICHMYICLSLNGQGYLTTYNFTSSLLYKYIFGGELRCNLIILNSILNAAVCWYPWNAGKICEMRQCIHVAV